jgi:hypothetical protein
MPRVGDVVRVMCCVKYKLFVGVLVKKFYRSGDSSPYFNVLWSRGGKPLNYEINGYLYSVSMFSNRYELYRDGVKY